MTAHYWLQITAGQGPDECALAVKHVVSRFLKAAKKHGFDAELLEAMPGKKGGTYVSALIGLKGVAPEDFLHSWQGSIQWICESPYRPGHPRKNWFIGVDVLTPPRQQERLDEGQLKFDTMRASGPGGQHVNTTDSAVRVTHLPTGLTATAQEERSQHMNKKLALARLLLLLEEQSHRQKASKVKEKWQKHQQLERGNPVRMFIGTDFKEKRAL
jgi:peptide chain release factor